MSRESLWTALHVVSDIAVWFCLGKSSEIWSSSCDQVIVNPALCCGRHCFYMRGCHAGFLRTVNTPSSVTVGGSQSLVVQAIPQFPSCWVSSIAVSRE